ncbi:catalase family peroxidase [Iodobacter ciconiae]|uniref:Catalase-related peroxidase n=1 Tax=Iodobacter ciconiae TaxID=2496266 RepID=A0A3S8ZSI2_9NEIS|nr:catalase family peroxidase [Iodobacter ciconiae]AZN36447.1 catalase family peroxidase [Iodobacter ciconiae]
MPTLIKDHTMFLGVSRISSLFISSQTLSKTITTTCLLAAALAAQPSLAGTTPTEMVDALNNIFGRHAGVRAAHAKGLCVTGQFEPASNASNFTSAAMFKKPALNGFGRFSIGGGNPGISDKSRTARGLAFRMGDGKENYDLVLISEPVSFAATPESFMSFLQARVPDPATGKPNPEKIAAHNIQFPDGKAQAALLASHPAPASYSTTAYHSTSAFGFTSKKGKNTWARLSLVPVAGTVYLDEATEASQPDQFLQADLQRRLAEKAIEFDLVAQHRTPGDSLQDSTMQWSGSKHTTLGRLKITAQADAALCDAVTFLPTILPAGVKASDDPILQARAGAYAVSFGRRLAK